jgi:glutaminyl-peptide cyclotransferase
VVRFVPLILVTTVAVLAAVFLATSGNKGKLGPFSGERAHAHVASLVGLGPRHPGSEAIARARDYISGQLREAGWHTSLQRFKDETPRGAQEFVNIRARFPSPEEGGIDWKRGGGLLLLCSHYDTKLIDSIKFVGANDGGSSSGVLLELATVLSTAPELARGIELVFFDGEEAVVEFTEVDGLYGSRHYAKFWRAAPAGEKPEAAFVLDLVGDARLRIAPPSDSPRGLLRELYSAAEAAGERHTFGLHPTPITDDHVPLNAAGIPALDVIDAGYISRGSWHTVADDLDSVTPESLGKIGRVMLELLARRSRD